MQFDSTQNSVAGAVTTPRPRTKQKRIITVGSVAKDQIQKQVASPLYSEAARFLKKDWVVKQKSLEKFSQQKHKMLSKFNTHFVLSKEIELRAMRKNLEGRLLINKADSRGKLLY